MNTPQRVTDDEFILAVATHVLYYRSAGLNYLCRMCGSIIAQVTATIEVHNKMYPVCSGNGEVRRIQIPYCPRCEPEPKSTGCVHIYRT